VEENPSTRRRWTEKKETFVYYAENFLCLIPADFYTKCEQLP
jgi:hypothetical protein